MENMGKPNELNLLVGVALLKTCFCWLYNGKNGYQRILFMLQMLQRRLEKGACSWQSILLGGDPLIPCVGSGMV